MTLRIANAAGFLGDNLDAPRRLLEKTEVDVLTLEYLAELTLSILAYQRSKHPTLGYARDFLTVLDSIVPFLHPQARPRVVTNAGGVHPAACAAEAARLLVARDFGRLRLACVTGDNLLDRLPELQREGCTLAHLDTGQSLAELEAPIVSAHAYLGGVPIANALDAGAEIVITGRVADASLTVGPAVRHYRWKWDDYRRLAGASVAGHLIECGAQVTGGYSVRWEDAHLHDVGYPIAEIEENGDCVITKSADTGGRVDRFTVVEQLVYEIGDPRRYLTPDVAVDFTSVDVQEVGRDRVAVRGAVGEPPPGDYKVSLAYRDGYMSSVQWVVAGGQCVTKARRSAELLLHRLSRAGYKLARVHVEVLGAGESAPGLPAGAPPEVVVRVAAHDPRREALERFTKEAAPLITSGPAGLAGYAVARSAVRPVFAYWPALVPRQLIADQVDVRTAAEWCG